MSYKPLNPGRDELGAELSLQFDSPDLVIYKHSNEQKKAKTKTQECCRSKQDQDHDSTSFGIGPRSC